MKNNIRSYNSLVYPENIIAAAIGDYRDIADISANFKNGYIECKFDRCVIDTERVMSEFDNYLIELINCREASGF